GDDPVRGGRVRFHGAGQFPDVVLQLPASRVECIPDRNVDVLMPTGGRRIAADVDVLVARYGDVHPDAIGVALVMTVLRAGDDHARGCDPVVKSLEPLRFLAHRCLDGVGMPNVLERDLEGYLHWRDLGSWMGAR